MSSKSEAEELLEKLAQRPMPRWAVEMLEYYRQTGTFRQKDLRRLLGGQEENDELLTAIRRIVKSKS